MLRIICSVGTLRSSWGRGCVTKVGQMGWTGIEQMDQLDARRSIVLARTASGLNLTAVPLP